MVLVALAGFVWGLSRNLRAQRGEGAASLQPGRGGEDPGPVADAPGTAARLARIELLLEGISRLECGDYEGRGRQHRPGISGVRRGETRNGGGDGAVTDRELADAIGRAEKRIRSDVAERFERQALAISSLREMIGATDALLERVLSRLEAGGGESELADLTPEEPLIPRTRTHGRG